MQHIIESYLSGDENIVLGVGAPPPDKAESKHGASNDQGKPAPMRHLIQIGYITSKAWGQEHLIHADDHLTKAATSLLCSAVMSVHHATYGKHNVVHHIHGFSLRFVNTRREVK